MAKGSLNTPMTSVGPTPGLGGNHKGGSGTYDRHNCEVVGKKADIGAGDISLKFYEDVGMKDTAPLVSPMGTGIAMGKKK